MNQERSSTAIFPETAPPATNNASLAEGIGRLPNLHSHELRAFTGVRSFAEQAEWLARRGHAFTFARNGMPLVARRTLAMRPTPERDESTTRAIAEIARAFAAPQPGFVYLMDESTDESAVKIGWARTDLLDNRMCELQVGNPRHRQRLPCRA